MKLISNSFKEKIARYLDRSYILAVWVLFMVFFVSLITVVSLPTISENVIRLFQIFSVLFPSTIFLFHLGYVEENIFRDNTNLSPTAKFSIIQAYNQFPKMGLSLVIGSLVYLFTLGVVGQLFIIGGIGILGSLGLGLFFFGIIFIIFYMGSLTDEVALTFEVISNYETVAYEVTNKMNWKNRPPVYPSYVWNFCMRQIVFKIEDRIKRHTGLGKKLAPSFYEPFHIVSVAAIMGKEEQKKKALEWVTELGKIMADKRIAKNMKIKFTVEHLQTVVIQQEFVEFTDIHSNFGFCCDFEHDRTRLLRWIMQATGTISSIRKAVAV